MLAGWSYQGPDMMSAAAAEMDALSARLNHVLRLGTGWMVQCDAIRSRAPGYPENGAFPDSISKLIDDERRQQFMAVGAHFESEYFLTLTYLPPECRDRLDARGDVVARPRGLWDVDPERSDDRTDADVPRGLRGFQVLRRHHDHAGRAAE